jgi:hypothetical protein
MTHRKYLGPAGVSVVLVASAFTFYSIHSQTLSRMEEADKMLRSGRSVSQLESIFGKPRYEWNFPKDLPDYVVSANGFHYRQDCTVSVYNMEGLPYWQVQIMYMNVNQPVLWYRIVKR